MHLAIFQDERVYEGNGNFLNAVYPLPALSHVVRVDGDASIIFGNVVAGAMPIFREDTFDPITRIRRGRFYCVDNPSPRNFTPDRVSHFPLSPPTGGIAISYTLQVYRSFELNGKLDITKQPLLHLGDMQFNTAWRVITIERLFNREILFVLKAVSALGVLPPLNEEAIPEQKRTEIASGFEMVADAVHKYLPVPLVDSCRELTRLMLSAWLPTMGVEPKGDLNDLADAVPAKIAGVRSAAKIIARLHSRGKSSERERQLALGVDLPNVSQNDGDLCVALVAFLLRDFGWAT